MGDTVSLTVLKGWLVNVATPYHQGQKASHGRKWLSVFYALLCSASSLRHMHRGKLTLAAAHTPRPSFDQQGLICTLNQLAA